MNTSTNFYVAQRIVQYQTQERIRDAERARMARVLRRVKPEHGRPAARRGRFAFGVTWAIRRAA